MIDTHAHIDSFDDTKLKEVLERAKKVNIEKIINPSAEPSNFERVLKIANENDFVYAALGVHPEETDKFKEDTLETIKELALKNKKVVAIGEIGLDYYWTTETKEKQKEIFRVQTELAKELKLPLIIHDREAHEDTFNILKSADLGDIKVIMHCFSGSIEFMKQCVKEGYYIALGGVVTFKNAVKPKEVAKSVPLERLLIETDCPYLAPVPYRGKENEPSYIIESAKCIAEIKGISFEELERITTKNAVEVFNL